MALATRLRSDRTRASSSGWEPRATVPFPMRFVVVSKPAANSRMTLAISSSRPSVSPPSSTAMSADRRSSWGARRRSSTRSSKYAVISPRAALAAFRISMSALSSSRGRSRPDERPEPRVVLGGHADELADDGDREREAERVQQLDLAGLDAVEDPLDEVADASAEGLDATRCEGPADEAPDARVVGRVEEQHRVAATVEVLGEGVELFVAEAQPRGESPRALAEVVAGEHRLAVVVAGQHPDDPEAGHLHPVHRRLLPQGAVVRIRIDDDVGHAGDQLEGERARVLFLHPHSKNGTPIPDTPRADDVLVLELLLPPRCPVCRRVEGPPRPGPCRRCVEAVPRPPALPPPAAVDTCVAVCAYDGAGVALVAALKFRGDRGRRAMGGGTVGCPCRPSTRRRRRRRDVGPDKRTAPATAGRRPGRGPRPCRRAGDAPSGPILARPSPGPAASGPFGAGTPRRSAFAVRSAATVAGAPRVLVVDDVVTTGASVTAAARALRAGGATTVVVACLARTAPGRHAP